MPITTIPELEARKKLIGAARHLALATSAVHEALIYSDLSSSDAMDALGQACDAAETGLRVVRACRDNIRHVAQLMPWWEEVVALCEKGGIHDKQPGFGAARAMHDAGLTPDEAFERCRNRPEI